jgi:hypothetical protein
LKQEEVEILLKNVISKESYPLLLSVLLGDRELSLVLKT